MTQKKANPKIEWGFFAVVPRVVRTQYKDLTHADKWLYTCLKDLCGDKGTCFRTLRSLKEETDISIASLSTMIPKLHDAGLIHAEKKRRSNSGKEVWHITIVDIWQSNKDFCSKIEQSHDEIVQNLNNVVQNLNEPTPDCSNIERDCSNFSDRRKNNEEQHIEERTIEEESIVVSAIAENDAPANVYHFEAEKKRITNGRIPVVNASHSQVDIGNDDFADRPTEKRPAVKKGQANDHTTMDTSRHSVVSNLGASDTSGAGTDRQTRRSQNEGLEITQTPGAGSPPAATPPGGSTATSVQASRSGPPADAAQRTASSPGTPSGAVQASVRDEKPHMALTAKQIEKQLQKRQDEILALYASKIGRKPSRSKANLDGALKLAQDDATDEDIGTTIDAILADSFLAKNLSLTFVHSKLDALARKPIPIENKQNGKAPAFVIDEERNRRNIEAMKARNAARRLAANG